MGDGVTRATERGGEQPRCYGGMMLEAILEHESGAVIQLIVLAQAPLELQEGWMIYCYVTGQLRKRRLLRKDSRSPR